MPTTDLAFEIMKQYAEQVGHFDEHGGSDDADIKPVVLAVSLEIFGLQWEWNEFDR